MAVEFYYKITQDHDGIANMVEEGHKLYAIITFMGQEECVFLQKTGTDLVIANLAKCYGYAIKGENQHRIYVDLLREYEAQMILPIMEEKDEQGEQTDS